MNLTLLPDNLQEYLQALPPAALQRIADEPVERWTCVMDLDKHGCRCLAAIAENYRGARYDRAEGIYALRVAFAAASTFDAHCRDVGLPEAVAQIQAAVAELQASAVAVNDQRERLG